MACNFERKTRWRNCDEDASQDISLGQFRGWQILMGARVWRRIWGRVSEGDRGVCARGIRVFEDRGCVESWKWRCRPYKTFLRFR